MREYKQVGNTFSLLFDLFWCWRGEVLITVGNEWVIKNIPVGKGDVKIGWKKASRF